jgi:hypothetical protein
MLRIILGMQHYIKIYNIPFLTFFQVWMKLCVDGDPNQLWDRHRPSKEIFDETQIAGYQFRSIKYPKLCMDYSNIKKKGKQQY